MHRIDQHVDAWLTGIGADVFVQGVFDAGHQLESMDHGVYRGHVLVDGVEGAGSQSFGWIGDNLFHDHNSHVGSEKVTTTSFLTG
ncbi:hypothetical protein D9M71_695180 [compost metagenome]